MSIPPISPSSLPIPVPSVSTDGAITLLQDVLTPAQFAALTGPNAASFLPPPDITLIQFLQELGALKLELEKQLKANELADNKSGAGLVQGVVDQASQLTELYKSMKSGINTIQGLVKSVTDSINTMNPAITNINFSIMTSNGTFINNANSAINTFNNVANATNATLASTQATTAQKNTAIANYNTAVGTLNSAIATINNRISASISVENAYQNVAVPYDQTATINNTAIDSFNHLSPVVKLDHQPMASLLFLSSPMPTTISTVSGIPASVSTYNFNAFNYLNAGTFLPLPLLTIPLSVLVINVIAVFLSIFAPFLEPLFNLILYGRTTLENIDELQSKAWNDPNVKIYAPVPPAYVQAYAAKPGGGNSTQAGSLTTTVSVTNLGSGLVSAALNKDMLASMLEGSDPNLSVEALRELIKLLQTLIAGLLGASAKGAIPGALGTVTPSLASLAPPPNSPTLTVVTGLSLLNRNLETVNSKDLPKAISSLIQKTPPLNDLTATQQGSLSTQLTGAVALTLLLVGAKILSEALGLPNLLAQLLGSIPSIAPDIANITSGPQPVGQVQGNQNVLNDLTKSFAEKGFNPEDATFLATIGLANLQNRFLGPTATLVTPQTTDIDLMTDSLAGQLLLNQGPGLDVVSAQQQARTLINQALNSADSLKASRVRDELIHTLIQSGINTREAQIMASNVLIIPNQVIPTETTRAGDLAALQQPVTNPQLAPVINPQLSTDEIAILVRQRTLELLAPEVGSQQAKVIADNLVESLIGPPLVSNKGTVLALAEPNSFIRQVKDSVQAIKGQNEKVYNEGVQAAFKEYIKPSVDLNPFLLKILDPAYFFLAAVSIINQQTKTQFSVGQGRNSGVDIPI
jgi:hypothetical protein